MPEYDFHEFPKEEYELRYEKARALMSAEGLDALMISDDNNCRYFSGVMPPTKNRPQFVILPLQGKPVLFLEELQVDNARAMSWIGDIRTYSLPFVYEPLRALIQELELFKSRIGVETHDQFFGGFRMSIQSWEMAKLQARFSRTRFVDTSNLLWRLRMVKTEAEAGAMRKACEITSKAYDAILPQLREGMSEREAARRLIDKMMELGADYPARAMPGPCAFIFLNATHPPGAPAIPINKPLRKGDLLWIDSGTRYKGYCADFGRSAVIGKATAEQKKAWYEVKKRVVDALKFVRPGEKLGNIPVHWHGLGLNHVEAPFRGIANEGIHGNIEIEPGMTLAVERSVHGPTGETYSYEENVLVTKNGCEILSTAKGELYEL